LKSLLTNQDVMESRMMDLTTLRTKQAVKKVLNNIRLELKSTNREFRIMEVCGTHTMTAYRSGLGHMLRKMGINLISGPGCPVCVTPDWIFSDAVSLVTNNQNVILVSFGDLLRVPTAEGSLLKTVSAPGSRIQVVYSPEETLKIARNNPNREIVFFAAGFETTIPGIAWIVQNALQNKINNFTLIPAMKLVPPPLKALLDMENSCIDGFIYPGHVSVIIGPEPYTFIPRDYGLPGAIAGFEPVDLLLGVWSVLKQIRNKKPIVDNVYRRAVIKGGNQVAQALMKDMFAVGDTGWRGFGNIPLSGMIPAETFSAYSRFDLKSCKRGEPSGCICAEIITGAVEPENCPLYGITCKPDTPVGPCMVTYEGSCYIHFKYGKEVLLAEN